ncbi:tetratricopeptide repeat protein [Anaerobacillus alkaliphilus]|uniref:Tetratricopeptide repeat protein n=1 Tax=Anaerobacillus alkaliphilus TaxID=1548597 RepID=A0A4Q0VTT0_9BACI|nr:tetratricopeptide repeat protein [Anaerobacillus alkaliphilus]RXJ01679.1 tetratricopeptide repeat protein [Anaerobacillus alkaliphilus]
MEPNKEKPKSLAKQMEEELNQAYLREKGERRNASREEELTVFKSKKKFTKIQSIVLLTITLFFSTGGGFALGHFHFWNSAEMKRVNEQLEYYQERVRINPSNLEDRIVLGYTHYLKGNNNHAVNEFKFVLQQDDQYYDAYYNLGLVYLEEKKYYEALSMFNKTVEIAPRDFKGHVQKGIAYRHLNMYEEAISSLIEATKLAPANADIIYQIGLVAEEQGDYENAIEIYKNALQYDPLFTYALDGLERLEKMNVKVGE